jgi:virulence-associated protein VapD
MVKLGYNEKYFTDKSSHSDLKEVMRRDGIVKFQVNNDVYIGKPSLSDLHMLLKYICMLN